MASIDLGSLCLAAMVVLWGLGALAAVGGRRIGSLAVVYGTGLAGSLAGLAAGILGLLASPNSAHRWTLPGLLPFHQPSLLLDPLGALFLALLGGGGAAASVYALGYLRTEARARDLRSMGACFHLFLLSMAMVVLANDALTFLIAWEVMALASLGLVLSGSPGRDGRHAGLVYVATMHVGTGLILLALLQLAQQAGSWSFDAFRASGWALPEPARTLVFAAALLGFGMKAGLVPLHGWLPLAHPAAPSHVSALMSGVMVKLGALMFVRVAFEFLGGPTLAWGAAVLALGVASALVGVLFALVEKDLKRLLAFSTVENLGLVFAGLGLGLLLEAWGQPAIAALAVAAALLHVVNHMAFKSLLFLGAGAVVHGAGTRSLEALGGLVRRMPRTATLFLVGCAAIAALPPLNGFVSEWMLLQSFVGAVHVAKGGPFAVGMVVGAAALLALAAGLVGAAMVRAWGGVFTGFARSPGAEHAHEAPGSMLAAMAALALACGVLGLGAVGASQGAFRLAAPLVGLPGPEAAVPPAATVAGFAPMQPLAIAGLLVAGFAIAALAMRGSRGRRAARGNWACGEVRPEARFLLTPTAFGQTTAMVFASTLRPREQVRLEGAAAPYAPAGILVERGTEDLFEDHLYAPLPRALRVTAAKARAIQSGSLHLYIAYLLAALLLTLAVVAWR